MVMRELISFFHLYVVVAGVKDVRDGKCPRECFTLHREKKLQPTYIGLLAVKKTAGTGKMP